MSGALLLFSRLLFGRFSFVFFFFNALEAPNRTIGMGLSLAGCVARLYLVSFDLFAFDWIFLYVRTKSGSVSMGLIGFILISLGLTGFLVRFFVGLTGNHAVLPGFTEFHLILLGPILPGFLCRVWLGFSRFDHVLPSLGRVSMGLIGFTLISVGFQGFDSIFVGFDEEWCGVTGFYRVSLDFTRASILWSFLAVGWFFFCTVLVLTEFFFTEFIGFPMLNWAWTKCCWLSFKKGLARFESDFPQCFIGEMATGGHRRPTCQFWRIASIFGCRYRYFVLLRPLSHELVGVSLFSTCVYLSRFERHFAGFDSWVSLNFGKKERRRGFFFFFFFFFFFLFLVFFVIAGAAVVSVSGRVLMDPFPLKDWVKSGRFPKFRLCPKVETLSLTEFAALAFT